MKLKKGLATILTIVIIMCCSSVAAFASGNEASAAPIENPNPLVSIEPRGFNKIYTSSINSNGLSQIIHNTNWYRDKHIIVHLHYSPAPVYYEVHLVESRRVVSATLNPSEGGVDIFGVELVGNEKEFYVYAKLVSTAERPMSGNHDIKTDFYLTK